MMPDVDKVINKCNAASVKEAATKWEQLSQVEKVILWQEFYISPDHRFGDNLLAMLSEKRHNQ